MCSPLLNLPCYKEPPTCYPCCPVQGPCCLPCGMDPVTLRRPLIVSDSTFEYRPTHWPGMLLNNQDKKVRYQLINFERPWGKLRWLSPVVSPMWPLSPTCPVCTMCSMCPLPVPLSPPTLLLRGLHRHSIQSSSPYPVTLASRDWDALLALGSPPRPIAAFDKAVIKIGYNSVNVKVKA